VENGSKKSKEATPARHAEAQWRCFGRGPATAAQRAAYMGRESRAGAGTGSSRGSQKRKLTEAVEQLVAEGGHHLVDAEGMAGLELRPVDDGVIDELVGAGMVNDEEFDESD